jgi:hypothetical protein
MTSPAPGVGAVLQFLELVLPVEGDAWRHHVALFRRPDRRLQQPIEAEPAVVTQDPLPGVDRARHRYGMRRGQRHRMDLPLQIPLDISRGGGPARTVIGDDLALALRLHQRETVATDAGRLRLDHAEQRTGRNGRVHCGAAGAHHLDRGKRRLRVRGRHHGVLGMDR